MPREVSDNGFSYRVSVNIFSIDVSYGHDFLPAQRSRLCGPFRYLERVRDVRNFPEAFEKKVSAENMWLSQNIPT